MDKDKLRDIVYILVAILFSILAIKLVIWLIPIIIVLVLAYFIYKKLKESNRSNTWKREEQAKPSKKRNKRIIIDEEKD